MRAVRVYGDRTRRNFLVRATNARQGRGMDVVEVHFVHAPRRVRVGEVLPLWVDGSTEYAVAFRKGERK